MKDNRGYFGIGIINGKTPANLGTLWRSAYNFGAAFIFTIGRRYKKQCSDTQNTTKHIPLFEYGTFEEFQKHRPLDCQLVSIELTEEASELKDFKHPERAVYLLGAEDFGVPKEALAKSQHIIKFNTPHSLNVAVAGSIVMYDRTLN